MKIGQNLAIRFTIVSALITGAILIFIYILTRGFVHSDFIERLNQQNSLEILHYATPSAKDVIPPGSFMLVNPESSIYSYDGKLLANKGTVKIPREWLDAVKVNGSMSEERGAYTTVGKRHAIDGKTYLVFVSDKDLPGEHELVILQKAMIEGWILSIVLSFFAGRYFATKAMQSVKQVVNEVKTITKDNLSYRLKANNKEEDEIDELIVTFNALLQRFEIAFTAQKRFVQHASHELKTPLTAIMGEAELALSKDRQREDYKRTLEVVVSETERLINITQGLLALAHLEEGYVAGEMGPVNITSLTLRCAMGAQERYPARKFVINAHEQRLFIHGNEQLLDVALQNILENAVKYSQREVVIECFRSNKGAVISIQDFGLGIPSADLPKVKLPMFRAANVRDMPGAGLGLSLVERIVKVHNGEFTIISEIGSGTTCTLALPVIN